MTEKPMVFWNIKRLANEYSMSRVTLGRLLKSIGAKPWSQSSGTTGRRWYWEDEP